VREAGASLDKTAKMPDRSRHMKTRPVPVSKLAWWSSPCRCMLPGPVPPPGAFGRNGKRRRRWRPSRRRRAERILAVENSPARRESASKRR